MARVGLRVHRLTGVYQAEGTILGELRYLFGKLRGTAHCALCDVTHGWVRKKAEFRAFERTLPVPFDLVHLDERSDEVRRFTQGRTPSVVAHTPSGLFMLLETTALERTQTVAAFEQALGDALARCSLSYVAGQGLSRP